MRPDSASKFGGYETAMDAALLALDGLDGLMPHEISPNELTLSVAFDLIFKLQSQVHQLENQLKDLANDH